MFEEDVCPWEDLLRSAPRAIQNARVRRINKMHRDALKPTQASEEGSEELPGEQPINKPAEQPDFPQFPQLPAKLRLKIWKAALPDIKTPQLHMLSLHKALDNCVCEKKQRAVSPGCVGSDHHAKFMAQPFCLCTTAWKSALGPSSSFAAQASLFYTCSESRSVVMSWRNQMEGLMAEDHELVDSGKILEAIGMAYINIVVPPWAESALRGHFTTFRAVWRPARDLVQVILPENEYGPDESFFKLNRKWHLNMGRPDALEKLRTAYGQSQEGGGSKACRRAAAFFQTKIAFDTETTTQLIENPIAQAKQILWQIWFEFCYQNLMTDWRDPIPDPEYDNEVFCCALRQVRQEWSCLGERDFGTGPLQLYLIDRTHTKRLWRAKPGSRLYPVRRSRGWRIVGGGGGRDGASAATKEERLVRVLRREPEFGNQLLSLEYRECLKWRISNTMDVTVDDASGESTQLLVPEATRASERPGAEREVMGHDEIMGCGEA
jgi:hypothetical protein